VGGGRIAGEAGGLPAELARRIGVTRQTVIAIEQGRYSPSLKMAFEIARVFGLPLDEVFRYPARSGADEAGDGF
jgi:putative transcriptional regulator